MTPFPFSIDSLRLACRLTLFLLATACVGSDISQAQKFDEKFEHWPVKLTIKGTLIIENGLTESEDWERVLGRRKGRTATVFADRDRKMRSLELCLKALEERESKVTVGVLDPKSVKPLKQAFENSQIVCLFLGKPLSSEDLIRLRESRKAFEKYLEKGNTLVVGPQMAKAMPGLFFASPNGTGSEGLNLLPDTTMMLPFDGSQQARRGLLASLARHPRQVGIGLSKGAALVVSGRKIRVVGNGKATFMLMANERTPVRVQTVSKMETPRQPVDEWLVDLTEWRRDAIDRTLAPFPPARPKKPHVENGHLVIVGGGGMPEGLINQFIELAGGKEDARIVYVPCSEQEDVGENQRTVRMFQRLGIKHATFVHTKDRNRANTDEEFLAPLKAATGIWFGGGRQWNFADSYYGTEAHRLMKEVLKRGGVIGGSSAGASIQARYLARATPIGNFRIMAPGYERGGLGFISGVAIDQHFSQRKRQKDMTQLVNRYPQMLGIGIDEKTAIIVNQSSAKVVGAGKVHFYDRNQPVYPGRDDFIALPAGSIYDLAKREVIKDSRSKDKTEN